VPNLPLPLSQREKEGDFFVFMDSLIRGIKQISTGLKFTADKQMAEREAYRMSVGKYKDLHVSIFKFKGPYAERVSGAIPILKNLVDQSLPKYVMSQMSGPNFYLLTERVEPADLRKYPEFYRFVLELVGGLRERVLKEHNLEMASFGKSELGPEDLYFTEAGLVVAAGFELKFASTAHGEKREFTSIFHSIERDLASYRDLGPEGQRVFLKNLEVFVGKSPDQYKRRILGGLLAFLGEAHRPEEREKVLRTTRAVLSMHFEQDFVIHSLFQLLNSDIRLFLLNEICSQKITISKEVMKGIFKEFHLGIVCNDEVLKMSSLRAALFLVDAMDRKSREKLLLSFGEITKKGKKPEREAVCHVAYEKREELLRTNPETFYKFIAELVNSSDNKMKGSGVELVDALFKYIDLKFIALQVLPLVSSQLVYEEVQDKAFLLLERIITHLRRDPKDLRVVSGWNLGIIGKKAVILSGKVPLQKPEKKAEAHKASGARGEKRGADSWGEEEW
jgi:hypothetical protein